MSHFVSNFNVWSTAVSILEAEGWTVRTSEDGLLNRSRGENWEAKKGEIVLVGETPLELLGLAAIYSVKFKGVDEPYWWLERSARPWDELSRVHGKKRG